MVLYTTMIAVILLAFLLYTLPLRISRSKRTAIFIASVCIASVQIIANDRFSIWELFGLQFLLAILVTYFIMNWLQSNENETKAAVLTEMNPLFSFAELQKRAKMSETVDEYYRSSVERVSLESGQLFETDPMVIQEDVSLEAASLLDRTADSVHHTFDFEVDSSEFIDFTNRKIFDLHETSSKLGAVRISDEEQVLEARKKIFENLESQVAATVEPKQDDNKEVDVALNERLSHAFDDLEEIYLKKKQEGEQ
ncbi:hypothetical protein [Peribacillus loiseleuriae]|uniref:Uncharacterized protein n=1 Tax=Peribacillus loiseleuriae TaxID=1679170 RepID=A0A0K9GWW3_9BACI|nr:hypothetical protein [Peribacillus loiseleuriae]KMY51116.1 hypothetical protein AC625_17565 [Peribacillus loiseleuriae]